MCIQNLQNVVSKVHIYGLRVTNILQTKIVQISTGLLNITKLSPTGNSSVKYLEFLFELFLCLIKAVVLIKIEYLYAAILWQTL